MLSESVVGAFNDEGDDDDDEGGNEGEAKANERNCYEVIGTLSDPKGTPPSWAKEIVQVNKLEYNKLQHTATLIIINDLALAVTVALSIHPRLKTGTFFFLLCCHVM